MIWSYFIAMDGHRIYAIRLPMTRVRYSLNYDEDRPHDAWLAWDRWRPRLIWLCCK